jgi:hypothetical protein
MEPNYKTVDLDEPVTPKWDGLSVLDQFFTAIQLEM